MNREALMRRVLVERERQFDLPGREFDMRNGVNDWVAIIGRYLFEETRRGVVKPNRTNFEDSLVKAAAVLLAALEHCSTMEANEQFASNYSLDSDDVIG